MGNWDKNHKSMSTAEVRVCYSNHWSTIKVTVPDYFNFPSSRIDHLDALYEWLADHFVDKGGTPKFGFRSMNPLPNRFYIIKLNNIDTLRQEI